MVKKISFYVFFIIFTFIFSFSLFSQSPQNTLTITTYYPSPFGVYKELRVKRMAIGDNYYKSSDYCWEGICSTHISSNTGLIVEDNVGIGTDNPQAKLHVNGRIKALDPVDDDDVATKKYVDAQISGGVQWAGYTPSSYTGNLGGPKGAHQKCNNAYPGSHWCSVDEIMKLGMNYPYTYNVWIRDAIRGGYSGYCVLGGAGSDVNGLNCEYDTCDSWKKDSVSYEGPILTAGIGHVIDRPCSNSYRLPCCY